VPVVHDAHSIPERVDHRSRHETLLPRAVIGPYSVAPIDSSRSNVAAMSSTCQLHDRPPGSVAAPGGAQSRSTTPRSAW
jgi:hypothetical protein